jgi:1,5-anhydro-D-fructose reductase (1,5-anhydro-D-mannitol-forming)
VVRYGILGFGHHGEKRLMPGFAGAERSKAIAFWRNDQKKAAQTAEHYQLRSYESVEALCRADDVDAVFVTSPDALHLEHTEIALRSGKPVLCEKPMAMNAAECERMIAIARETGKLLAVAHAQRFEQSIRTAREWVASGRLGKILSARAVFTYPGYGSPRAWITDTSLACGGPTADVGVHCFDNLRYILQQEVVAVSAVMHSDEQSGAVEASASISLEFGCGTLSQVFVSTRAPYRTYLEIIGSERTLEARNAFTVDHPVELVLVEAGNEIERVSCDNSKTYGAQFDAFSDALNGGAPFPCSAEDGLINQRLIDAAYESAHTGTRIRL